jgi:D-alanyl-D-alanine carboxypeptidase (penicillin-binding protein 5/6)
VRVGAAAGDMRVKCRLPRLAIVLCSPDPEFLMTLFSRLAVIGLLFSSLSVHAEVPPPPVLVAKAWVLMDAASGNVLVDVNGQNRLPPASLTKLMTAHVAALDIQRGHLKPGDMVTISEKAWRTGGSKMFVKVGDLVSVKDLLQGIIVQSGNDASIALAEHIGGGEDTFVALMNQEAKHIGLANTHFMNATGLPDPNHYSSAYDMARLARAIILEDPQHYALYAEKEFVWNGIKQPNRNLLLWRDPSVDGLKTGHTDEAGFCMVASGKRGNQRLIAAVFGTESEVARATETDKLLTYGFNFFDSKTFYSAGQIIQTLPVWKGSARSVNVGVAHAFAVALPKRGGSAYQTRIAVTGGNLIAPIAKGSVLGKVELVDGAGKVVSQAPLVALEQVEQGGLFRRLWDGLRLFFKGIFG